MDEVLPDVEKELSEVEPQLPGVVDPEDDQGEWDEEKRDLRSGAIPAWWGVGA